MRLGVIGLQRDRPFQALLRLTRPTECSQRNAAAHVRLVKARPEADRPIIGGKRRVEPPELG